jgi:ubiquinone/menaquinone biosynthesis C-methylase UbiE
MAAPGHRWYAATYDFFTKLSSRHLEPLRRFAAGGAAGRVLEIGCGTGQNFDFYDWSRVESLIATEPDQFMLRRASERLSRSTGDVRSRVRLVQAPAECLPFEDASFDAVVCTLVRCTVEDSVRAASELLRVLKPGGEVRFVEHVAGQGMVAMVQNLIQPVWGWTSGGCHIDRDTEGTLREAGFDVHIEERFRHAPMLPAIRGMARRV